MAQRTALVTGAGRGLGRAIAHRLAVDGFQVLLSDVDDALVRAAANELIDEGHAARALVIDVTDDDAVRDGLAVLGTGSLDTLVNNAGIISRQPAEDFSSESFSREMDVNLGGAMRCSRAAYPFLTRSTAPCIVNLASVGSTFGLPQRLGYSTSKTGIVGLTRTLAAEWGRVGIRVNAVAPGYIETPMMLSGIESGALDRDRLLSRTPLMRFGAPAEVAAAVSFLVSADAGFVTGVVLEVDGGITIDGSFHDDTRHRSTTRGMS